MTLFERKIWTYYKNHGRKLPWRETRDPYRILVSEIMLQQTQVSRVLQKYPEFLEKFPTLKHLARAKQADVIKIWQGLGYNRRAVALHKIAQGGNIPTDPVELEKLPGVGPYTAAAIAVFAFGKKLSMIETNIRRVFEHEFGVTLDIDILPRLAKTPNNRDWYYALMDYGSTLPKTFPRPKQSTFVGSNRQIRGGILKVLAQRPVARPATIAKLIDFSLRRTKMNLGQLAKEGLVASRNGAYRLA